MSLDDTSAPIGSVGSAPTVGLLGEATRKRRRTSASSHKPGAPYLTEASPRVAPEAHLLRKLSGSICNPCGSKDSDPDPLNADEYILWGYPPKPSGEVQGQTCLYCVKTYNANWRARYKTITLLKSACAKDKAIKDEFKGDVQDTITHVKETGNVNMRIKNGAAASDVAKSKETVCHKRKRDSGVVHPEDEIWDETTYIEEFGHWKTNGRGHRMGEVHGIRGVLIPAKKVWKIRTVDGESVEQNTWVDDGEDTIQEDQADTNFSWLKDLMDRPDIVGQTIAGGFQGVSRNVPAVQRQEVPNQEPPATTPSKNSKSARGYGVHFKVDDVDDETPKATTPKPARGTGSNAASSSPPRTARKGKTNPKSPKSAKK